MFSDNVIVDLFKQYETNNKKIIDIDEFREDVMRITYVYRILKKYKESGNLNYRLLINHIIILYNVFGHQISKILVKESADDIKLELITVLVFLERIESEEFCQKTMSKLQELIK